MLDLTGRKMNEIDMEQVVGGSYIETVNDACSFQKKGYNIVQGRGKENWEKFSKQVREAWLSRGVTCITYYDEGDYNRYIINGKFVSWTQAWQYALFGSYSND